MSELTPLLGPLQVRILLALIALHPRGFIAETVALIERRTGRRVSLGTVHRVARQFLDEGILTSERHPSRPIRSGKARTSYSVSEAGRAQLLAELEQLDILRLDLPASLRHEDR